MIRLAWSKRRWVGGRRGDSCISRADLEPAWGLGHWVPALFLCEGVEEGGRREAVTGWAF